MYVYVYICIYTYICTCIKQDTRISQRTPYHHHTARASAAPDGSREYYPSSIRYYSGEVSLRSNIPKKGGGDPDKWKSRILRRIRKDDRLDPKTNQKG